MNELRWTADELQTLLGGHWLTRPSALWGARDFAIMGNGGDIDGDDCLFVAIDEETWHQGSGNTGVYAGWPDTHDALPKFYQRCCGAIVQHPVEGLPPEFPQFVVENSYAVLHVLADEARARMTGKVVAVTGTVGKSTIKYMLDMLLSHEGTVISSRGNHNTRTGASVTLARCIGNPDFAIAEVAISALWMRSGGVGSRIKPHIGIVSEIGLGQVSSIVRSAKDTAKFKARICNGIVPGGYALLNRDMEEFAYVRDEVLKYGARVMTYGFSDKANIRVLEYKTDPHASVIRANVIDREVEYRLEVPGKAMISNSLAALGAVSLLGADVAAAARRLADYKSNRRLESKKMNLPQGGQIALIDDSYNAEILSMKSAFEVASLYPSDQEHRRIAVLGRVINLGDQAPALHESLVEPLLAARFDKVFMHGDEMVHIQKHLPKEIDAGLFCKASELVENLLTSLQSGDTILLKGSTRNSDFGSIPKLLSDALEKGRDLKKPNIPAGRLIRLSTGEELAAGNIPCSARHFSQLLLLVVLAEHLSAGTIQIDERIGIRPLSASAARGGPIIGWKVGEKIPVSVLVRAIVVWNARDAAISLAERLFGSSAKAVQELQLLTEKIGLDDTVVLNVSGREQPGQKTTLGDLAKFLQYFYKYHSKYLHWFSDFNLSTDEKSFRTSANIVARGGAAFGFSSRGASRWGFAIARIANNDFLACVAGADDAFNLDYHLDLLLLEAEKQCGVQSRALPHSSGTAEFDLGESDHAIRINFLGDTYFGEWYTRRRQKRGVEDALTRFGYDYSFKELQPLLDEGNFNIANFEAALASEQDSSMKGRKPFVLIGEPRLSVAALKDHSIHAVALGNNHAVDAGLQGLDQSIGAFQAAEIAYIGAGCDAEEAERPLILRAQGRTFKIFSAYWYRQYMEQDCSFYALPRRGGAACISGGLLDRIISEKRQPNPATVIVLAHWGTDYSWTDDTQRRLAKRMLAAGADLIIGSGPHMLGECEQYEGRWVIYSIGNGIFNSDGEYKKRKVPPFSFFTRLIIDDQAIQLRLYPILTDNQDTFWQPRIVTKKEFDEVIEILSERNMIFKEEGKPPVWHTRDEAGRYAIVMPIHT